MEAWERFLVSLEKELGKQTVDRWLRSLKVVNYDAGNLYLEAENSFQVAWFEEQIRTRALRELVNNNHRSISVHLAQASSSAGTTPSKRGKEKSTDVRSAPVAFTSDALDPQATFSNFVAGAANLVTFKLLFSLAEGKEALADFNPIYLHGPAGTGKTHLLMATATRLKERGIKALYVRAETFTEHVVNAIRAGVMREFRDAYRHVDVLLFDDVHLFARKAATQEELFHTFNTLHTSGRQIILSGGVTPSLLKEIEPRLVSRFEWGVLLQLERLSQEEMREMLAQRSSALDFSLSGGAQAFLVHTFGSSNRRLHEALEALVLRTHLEKKRFSPEGPSPEEAKQLLHDLVTAEKAQALTPEKIIRATADTFEIRVDDLLGKSQNHEYTLPRQTAMYLCRLELAISYLKIGSLFGRDHSTVMSSVKQIKTRLERGDKELRHAVDQILARTDAEALLR